MENIHIENMRERIGNIDQVRDLLFGHIVKDYERRFGTHAERLGRLEHELSAFQTEVRDRLAQLQESLGGGLNSQSSLEKQFHYLQATSHEEANRLKSQIGEIEQNANHNLEALRKVLGDRTTALKTELLKSRENLEETIRALEKRVFEEIERDLTSLKADKIARIDLADFLFEVCLKLKGAELIAQLPSSTERSRDAEYLLPQPFNSDLEP